MAARTLVAGLPAAGLTTPCGPSCDTEQMVSGTAASMAMATSAQLLPEPEVKAASTDGPRASAPATAPAM